MSYNYFYSDKKEDHVAEILKSKGYSVELIRIFDSDGNRLAQVIEKQGGYKVAIPDIDVYESEDKKEAILRVEVKGFFKLPKSNGKNYLLIEKRKFNNYFEYFLLSEVPTKVIFVIGTNDKKYEYYWGTLESMNDTISFSGEHNFDKNSPSIDCYFWNVKDLNYGLDGFC